jgi:hypothetical protein
MYHAIFLQIFENNDEKQYNKISIRKFVLNNSKKNIVSKSMIKKKISSLKKLQLFTFDNTSSFKSTSINNFVAIEISRFFFKEKLQTKKWLICLEKINHWTKKIIFFLERKILFVRFLSKLSNKLLEIENVLLNVLTSKNIKFRINVINIVQQKRV